VIDVYIYIYT
jgi:hypothetical protein